MSIYQTGSLGQPGSTFSIEWKKVPFIKNVFEISKTQKKRYILLVGSQTFGVRSEIALVSNMASPLEQKHSTVMHSSSVDGLLEVR